MGWSLRPRERKPICQVLANQCPSGKTVTPQRGERNVAQNQQVPTLTLKGCLLITSGCAYIRTTHGSS